MFYPLYGSGLFGYGDNGVARYNSLQGSLLKRYSHGFTFQMNYTWSKSIDDIGTGLTGNSGGGDQVLPWYSPFYDQVLKGPSDFDHAHRFVTSYVWDIPFGNHMKGVAKGRAGRLAVDRYPAISNRLTDDRNQRRGQLAVPASTATGPTWCSGNRWIVLPA